MSPIRLGGVVVVGAYGLGRYSSSSESLTDNVREKSVCEGFFLISIILSLRNSTYIKAYIR